MCRRLDDAALDRLAALTLALQSLEGVPSRQRLLLLQLSLHVSQLKGTLREGDLAEVRGKKKKKMRRRRRSRRRKRLALPEPEPDP